MNKLTFAIGLILLSVGVGSLSAQDVWEPQTNITGYISTEFNGFSELKDYRNSYGISLSEAGILTSYKPTKELIFKSVFVYRPDFTFDQMLNEANVQYSVTRGFNVKAGRFLTPLSPMNTYYYAPVNTSATLPTIISNYEFFPLNMDAISINGSAGADFSVSYDVFAGGFKNTTWMKTGPVGFFGNEIVYYKDLMGSRASYIDPSFNETYNVAFGGNLTLKYNDFMHLGFSAFKPKDDILPGFIRVEDSEVPGSFVETRVDVDLKRFNYGTNLKLKYNNTKIIAELWKGDLSTGGIDKDLEGAFVELSHNIDKITPYTRYEVKSTDDVKYERYTAGVMYKPMFETTFKLEYLMYEQEVEDIQGVVASFIYSF